MGIQCSSISNDKQFSFSVIAVNPQAQNDLWIVSDYECSDRMFRFHQMKTQAKTDDSYATWFMFRQYDIFTHTAMSTGEQLTQILNAVTAMLNSYRRLPAVLVILMGEKLMYDKRLLSDDLELVLHGLCRKVI